MDQNLISPLSQGLVTDVDPWSLPPDAFSELNNFAVNYGRLEKRPGMVLLGQMLGFDNNPTTDRVMGITTSTDADGVNQTVAFTQTVMNYWDATSPGTWVAVDIGAQAFNGSDTDYYSTYSFQATGEVNRLFITNGKALNGTFDGLRYWEPSTPGSTTSITPTVSTNVDLWGAKLVFAFRGRLVVLYTTERDTFANTTSVHPQRARWSQTQNTAEWDDTKPGEGSFVDAPTGEQIISAQFIRDSLMVYFTDSVWILYYTGDKSNTFLWKKINSFRACGAKMASQGFDSYIGALGVRGITGSTGAQTERIDQKIQEFVVNSVNTANFDKVYCGRSYATSRWWTLYPRRETSSEECDGVLVFHMDNQCWSTYSTSLNVLGHGVSSFNYTCDSFTSANNRDWTCQEVGDATCQDYYWQSEQNMFLGGDREGKVYILEQTGSDDGEEIVSTFTSGVLNQSKVPGITSKFEYIDILMNTEKYTTGELSFYQDSAINPYMTKSFNLLPPIGFIASIQNITQANPPVVTSFAHGLSTGDEVYIYGVLGMRSLSGGPYTVTVVNASSFSLDGEDSTAFTAYGGAGGIYRNEFYRTKVWKRIYAGGVSAQHRISLSSPGIDDSLTIYALRPRFRPAGRSEIY